MGRRTKSRLPIGLEIIVAHWELGRFGNLHGLDLLLAFADKIC